VPPATRGRRPASALAAAPEQTGPTIEVEITPGQTKTYPDVTADWARYQRTMGARPRVVSNWVFMRDAQLIFMRSPAVAEVRGWSALDDSDLVYAVRAYRTSSTGRQVRYEVLGAARLDAAMATVLDDGPSEPDPADGIEQDVTP